MSNRSAWIGSLLLGLGLLLVFGLRHGFLDPVRLAGLGDATGTQPAPEAPEAAAFRPAPEAAGTPTASVRPPEFSVLYGLTRREGRLGQSRAGKVINRSGILRLVTDDLNRQLRLQRAVVIKVHACGEVSPFYDPSTSTISLCDEFFDLLEQLFAGYGSQPEFEHAVLGATLFVTFHEIGHALVDQLDLPLIGRQEDAVDALATYLLLRNGAADVAFRGAEAFAYLSQRSASPVWGEHSLHAQRFYNIACLLFGAAPHRYAWLVASGTLPQRRAERCAREFDDLSRGAQRLLEPHLRG